MKQLLRLCISVKSLFFVRLHNGSFQQLFGPDLEINTKIGRLLACGQYEQCAHYLHECLAEKPRKLKRSLNYLIGHSRIEEKGKMHRYKMVNEMYELCFKEKSKYYKEAFYHKCVDAEENQLDKPIDFGAEAYSKSKEVKPLNSVEAINVYMSNPVQVNQDLVLKVPTMPIQRDSLQSLETVK